MRRNGSIGRGKPAADVEGVGEIIAATADELVGCYRSPMRRHFPIAQRRRHRHRGRSPRARRQRQRIELQPCEIDHLLASRRASRTPMSSNGCRSLVSHRIVVAAILDGSRPEGAKSGGAAGRQAACPGHSAERLGFSDSSDPIKGCARRRSSADAPSARPVPAADPPCNAPCRRPRIPGSRR